PQSGQVHAPLPSLAISERGGYSATLTTGLSPSRPLVALAMPEEPTTAAIQRYLNALPADTTAEPIIRELLDRAVCRLRALSAGMLYRKDPRLTQPPLDLEADRVFGGVRVR